MLTGVCWSFSSMSSLTPSSVVGVPLWGQIPAERDVDATLLEHQDGLGWALLSR